jgi:C4-dicarboxylate-specific signal transduction histidine kinase
MADVIEITILEDGTSEVIERDFTPEEQAQRDADAIAAAAAQQAADEAELKKQQDKQSAADKLAALGLTVDEIAALVGA